MYSLRLSIGGWCVLCESNLATRSDPKTMYIFSGLYMWPKPANPDLWYFRPEKHSIPYFRPNCNPAPFLQESRISLSLHIDIPHPVPNFSEFRFPGAVKSRIPHRLLVKSRIPKIPFQSLFSDLIGPKIVPLSAAHSRTVNWREYPRMIVHWWTCWWCWHRFKVLFLKTGIRCWQVQ